MYRLILVTMLGWGVSPASGQELEPRSYGNVPIGMNFLLAGYGYSQGRLLTDPLIPLEDVNLSAHGAALAYVRSLDVLGRSAKVGALVPHAWLSGSAEFAGIHHERNVSGFGDPIFRFSVNLIGAPALSLKEFAAYRQDLIVGATLQMSVPLGQYDSDSLFNIGTNRWYIKPEVGVSKAWKSWILEGAAGVTVYSENDDFLRGNRRKEDPLYSFQGHVIYEFPGGIWLGANGTYYAGGRTTVNGIKGDDLQRNTRMGATLSLPLDRANSVKFFASTGMSVRRGLDFDAVGLVWQYRWGGEP